jgi:ABC-type antimicrobial peptide transport system permease subunit
LGRHAVLPLTILAAIGAAGIARYARTSVADILAQDWVRTARAKGLAPRRVYLRHVLFNILPAMIVLFALSLPGVVAGSIFVESVFAWPGMGRLMVTAIAATYRSCSARRCGMRHWFLRESPRISLLCSIRAVPDAFDGAVRACRSRLGGAVSARWCYWR